MIQKFDKNLLLPINFSYNHYMLDTKENIDKFKSIFLSYNGKRAKENYSLESFNNLIKENRFSYGVFENYVDKKLISFYGLCDYYNWIIMARYASFEIKNLPIGLAYSIPKLLEKIQKENKNGIIMTFNKYNKLYWKSTMSDFRRRIDEKFHKTLRDHEVIIRAQETVSKFKHLNHPVLYKSTAQYISYVPLKDNEPLPFEPYEK